MTRIIGDRKEKSALDEMIEVSRQRNKDVAEEERLEALRKKKEAINGKVPSEPVIVPAGDIITSCYNGLEFEPLAYSQSPDNMIMTYGRSLEWVKKRGYQRHPLPAEVFSLLADNLEGKLQKEYKAVAKNMLSLPGEWLSMAMERKGDILVCYLHPEGLVWDNDAHIYREGFKYDCKYEFDISGKTSKWGISLMDFEDEFVKLLYGRSFESLPKEMRAGTNRAHIDMPKDGELFPVCRMRFTVSGHSNGNPDWLSRGVRKLIINSNTNGGN